MQLNKNNTIATANQYVLNHRSTRPEMENMPLDEVLLDMIRTGRYVPSSTWAQGGQYDLNTASAIFQTYRDPQHATLQHVRQDVVRWTLTTSGQVATGALYGPRQRQGPPTCKFGNDMAPHRACITMIRKQSPSLFHTCAGISKASRYHSERCILKLCNNWLAQCCTQTVKRSPNQHHIQHIIGLQLSSSCITFYLLKARRICLSASLGSIGNAWCLQI